jgi:hypothetical protein
MRCCDLMEWNRFDEMCRFMCREFLIINNVKRNTHSLCSIPYASCHKNFDTITSHIILTMSLASVAFSRLATKIINPQSWLAATTTTPTIGAAFLQRSGIVGSHHHQKNLSIRSVFSEVIRQIPSDDPKKQGKLTFEDPDLADARIGRNIRGECK